MDITTLGHMHGALGHMHGALGHMHGALGHMHASSLSSLTHLPMYSIPCLCVTFCTMGQNMEVWPNQLALRPCFSTSSKAQQMCCDPRQSPIAPMSRPEGSWFAN